MNNINYVVGGIAMVGAIAGVVYAKKTGGGFWRYVGYWIAGGLVVGVPARLVALPFKNKILREGDKNKIVVNTNNTNTKEQKPVTKDEKEVLATLQKMPPIRMM